MKIQCPSCKLVVAETAEAFNPNVHPNGSMLQLVEPYKSRGWGQIMNWNVGICCAELYCPMCNYPLAPSGRFMVVPEGAAEPLPVGGVGPEKVVEATASVSDDVCLEVNTAVAICPKCGRPETAFKNKSGFVNHCRICGRGVKG